MMGEFEAIRPYSDAEVPAVLQRLLSDDAFLGALVRYRFPRLAGPLGWLLKPLIAHRLAREVTGIRSVATLQDKFEPYVDHTIEKATDGVTYSGVNRLKPGCAYLFIANHRDIVMDPAFVNYAVYHAGLPTPRIAIGDNLLQKSFVSDLMRLNKSFIVHRSLSGRREARRLPDALRLHQPLDPRGPPVGVDRPGRRAGQGRRRPYRLGDPQDVPHEP